MTGIEFKQKLHTGERVFGTRVSSADPPWTNLAKDLDLDFVFIDNEHYPVSSRDTAAMCRLHAGMGIAPIVRIPRPEATLACQAYDWGAWGVVVPYVEKPEQVREMIGAAKFSPLKGELLMKGITNGEWQEKTKTFLDNRNQSKSLIVNIESVPAVKKLPKIAAIPGLDALLIGPHDMTISMGMPEQYDHPLFLDTVDEIVQTARAHGLGAGIHSWWNLEQDVKWLTKGLNLLIHSSDYRASQGSLEKDLKVLREQS